MRKGAAGVLAIALVGAGFVSAQIPPAAPRPPAALPSTSPADDQVVPSKMGLVVTRRGATFEGEITERGGMVIVKSSRGIETRIKREDVLTIEVREDAELEFNTRLRKLVPSDVQGRVELARFALNKRRPDLARQVLLEALALNPNDRDASLLYDTARSQIELDRKSAANREAGGGAGAGGESPKLPETDAGPATRQRRPANAGDVLNDAQINRVRQVELRQGEIGMTFKFENDVERRFAQRRLMTPGNLLQLTPLQRFLMMREGGDPDILKDVRLLRDPAVVADFRQKIQPVLLTGCARSGCHSESTMPTRSFILHTQGESESRDYTNFYILATARYSLVLANGQRVYGAMVDRTSPERSILLQYSLPPGLAQFSHPPVAGYRGVVQGPEDARFRNMLVWIRDTISPQDPQYGFTFGNVGLLPVAPANPPATMPGDRAATQPAAPTTAPVGGPVGTPARGSAGGGAGGEK